MSSVTYTENTGGGSSGGVHTGGTNIGGINTGGINVGGVAGNAQQHTYGNVNHKRAGEYQTLNPSYQNGNSNNINNILTHGGIIPTCNYSDPKNSYPGLESYKILEKLGEGAFSIVHKALSLKTNQFVAIKIIKKQQLDNNQKLSVQKEVFIMNQLSHDHIVKFVEFRETPNHYYIIQELVEGGEIFNEIVKFTYFSENLARHVIRQVGEAVKYLHEKVGVVHRDIKPENLLFVPIPHIPSDPATKARLKRRSDDPHKKDEGEFKVGIGGGGIGIVKLADFGLSKQIWRDGTKTPCGTIGYSAPEIIRDQKYSKEVDMWGIGCVLYTLLCGFPPFYDEKIDVLTEKVAKGDFQFLSPWWDEISVGAKNCVKNLLLVDPKKRYTIDQFLRDPWLNELQFKSFHRIVLEDFRRAEPIYSPVARAMKDAFDISSQIHRIGEENLLQRRIHEQENIFEEEEEGEEDDDDDGGALINNANGNITGRQIKQVPIKKTETQRQEPFELKLDTATILSRRRKQLEC